MKLIFLQWNNYFNHIAIRAATVSGYSGEVYRVNNVQNFNFNDGVDTDHVINLPSTISEPDYMLLTDDYGEILSRWYVLDVVHTRASQCRVKLRRDLVADTWDVLKDAPLYVKRALLSEQDELVTAPEGWNFNQIKKSETPLKDYTNIPWIVGYVDLSRTDIADIKATLNHTTILEVNGIANYEYYNYSSLATNPNTFYTDVEKLAFAFWANDTIPTRRYRYYFGKFNDSWTDEGDYNPYITIQVKANTDEKRNEFADNLRRSFTDNLYTILTQMLCGDTDSINRFKEQDGIIIKDTATNKYYSVKFSDYLHFVNKNDIAISSANDPELWAELENVRTSANALNPSIGTIGTANELTYKYTATAVGYQLSITQVSISELTCPISATRNILNDQPYCMFAIPYGDITIDTVTYHSADYAMLMARAISKAGAGSGGWLYDIQLLPYNPITALLHEGAGGTTYLSLSNMTNTVDYSPITIGADTVSYIFWAKRSTFRHSVPYTVSYSDVKVKSQTDFLRICAPGYDGVYEFNPYANRGLTSINIDCTYKPYNSYIHVVPQFNAQGLYGLNFGDARGLICRGDFSLPQTSDAFATYERNNVNYQKIFDRGIKSQMFSATINLAKQAKSAGKQIGSGIAEAAAGDIGGLGTAANALLDISGSVATTIEGFQAQKEINRLQLEQIAAQSDTLINVGAITANYKYFPFIEHYSCTETETEAARNTVKYSSMAVNRIGTISEFLNNRIQGNPYSFISGSLIRLIAPGLDAHMVQKLSEELERGIYLTNTLL